MSKDRNMSLSSSHQSVFITGVAGFIGFHTAKSLLEQGYKVVGIDNLNAYYDPKLKKARLKLLGPYPQFSFHSLDLSARTELTELLCNMSSPLLLHLAAQAGVRHSFTDPYSYGTSNLTGFLHVLEAAVQAKVRHLMFASSSSVYGANTQQPFSEKNSVDHPISLYAATKRSNELMAHVYAHIYKIPCTGLRFFTVYGPYGRPDMALFKFTKAMLSGRPIEVYNYGKMARSFTYISDVVEALCRLIEAPPPASKQSAAPTTPTESHVAPYQVYNIGSPKPVSLLQFIKFIEQATGCKANMNLQEMQKGDVEQTFADTEKLTKAVSYTPKVSPEEGVRAFVNWYMSYYKETCKL